MRNFQHKTKQSGAVLFISLILLLIMTLLGISGMQTTILEEKMAGNFRNANLAFQSAEAALRASEGWLSSQASEPLATNNGTTGVWTNAVDPDTTNSDEWWEERDNVWWVANAVSYGTTLSGITTPPRTIIKYKTFQSDTLLAGTGGSATGLTFYQVTSRGTGGTDQAKVLLQSTTARRY
ncbi:MAG: pilus assembly protein PilX [Cycloclasticus sp.]|nr:pilus assembly protein PilX [Cycloclasticus sp.]